MRIILNGACGRMGREVRKLIDDGFHGAKLSAGVDTACYGSDPLIYDTLSKAAGDADVIIDFSSHTCCATLCEYAVERKLPLVIATTGHTKSETEAIIAASAHIPVFFSANLSMGIAALCRFSRAAAALFSDADIEIVETHHSKKADAPSGTALMIAKEIGKVRTDISTVIGRRSGSVRKKGEIGIHSVRLGDAVGEHEVIVSTGCETLRLIHTAHTRALFAKGAIEAAEFIIGKPPGIYGTESMLHDENDG